MVRNRETMPRGSCLTTAPYLKLPLLFLLGEEGEKLNMNIGFIRKYTLGEKKKKFKNHHKPMKIYTCGKWEGPKLAGQQGQAEAAAHTYLVALHWSAAGWCTGRAGHWGSWAGQGLPLLSRAESSHWGPAGQSGLAALQHKVTAIRLPQELARRLSSLLTPPAAVAPLFPSSRASLLGKWNLRRNIWFS